VSTVSCVVATFGPEKAFWDKLAHRAIASIAHQTRQPNELHRVHVPDPDSLHVARNRGASMSKSDWLIFVDADDTIHPNYIEAMLAGEGDVRIPNVERWWPDGPHEKPHQIRDGGDLLQTSHILIGAMVRRELFIKVGGFEDLPIWEDWHFWCKCWVDGAVMLRCPGAIYQAQMREDSRSNLGNSRKLQMSIDVKRRIRNEFKEIAKARGLLGEQKNAAELKRRFGIEREPSV